MTLQNLRNKYCEHPIIKPLIDYCKEQNISFELVKETKILDSRKSFHPINTYYAKIGDSLLYSEQDFYFWDNLLALIINTYKHLGIDCPANLTRAVKMFSRHDSCA